MNATARVLVVDDEAGIRKTLRAYLEQEGYTVQTAADGGGVIPAVRAFQPDVVILDIMLPGVDGLEVLRQLRQESSVYVLMLTARSEEADRLVGLRMGADDYVVKPFSPREVVARVATLLRRDRSGRTPEDQLVRFPRLAIDPGSRQVWKDDVPVSLTAIEFDLLHALAAHRGRVLNRDQLIERAWGDDYYIDERVVDVHIRRLRVKIEDDPDKAKMIVTVRSVGYRFEADEA